MKFDFLQKKENKINVLLTVIAVFLFGVFIFSTIGQNKSEKRKKNTTALLNPKYESTLSKIQISDNNNTINLQKQNDLWILSSTTKNSTKNHIVPANSTYIDSFIKDLSSIINLYEITQLNSKNKNNFFPEDKTVEIKYFYNDSDFTTLYFGKTDFSQSYRYFMTDKNVNIYEIPTTLDKYLQTSYQVWAEPFLISQSVLGNIKSSDIQTIKIFSKKDLINQSLSSKTEDFETKKSKLLDLRHGGRIDDLNELILDDCDLSLQIENGNKSEIQMKFFNQNSDKEEYFIVQVEYKSSEIKISTFNYKISLWTYNKIKEIIL